MEYTFAEPTDRPGKQDHLTRDQQQPEKESPQMPKIHFLNVKQGDCIIIEHVSGRVTLFDISAGNIEPERGLLAKALLEHEIATAKGNYGMCRHPTNPLDYLTDLKLNYIHRFILSHPDMDHLDGFDALLDRFLVGNFWDSGARKDKPDFGGQGGRKYNEEDWDRYASVIAGKEPGTNLLRIQAGARFKYANEGDGGNPRGDGLLVLAPDRTLIDQANERQEFNDASYIVLYHSPIGKVLLTGDADNATWDYVLNHYANSVSNVALLIAPHHGRDSGRRYDFLDHIKPKITLFGCAPSKDLAYDAWNNRGLLHFTNNQCGCIVAEGTDQMDIYVENEKFAANVDTANLKITNSQGYYHLGTVTQ